MRKLITLWCVYTCVLCLIGIVNISVERIGAVDGVEWMVGWRWCEDGVAWVLVLMLRVEIDNFYDRGGMRKLITLWCVYTCVLCLIGIVNISVERIGAVDGVEWMVGWRWCKDGVAWVLILRLKVEMDNFRDRGGMRKLIVLWCVYTCVLCMSGFQYISGERISVVDGVEWRWWRGGFFDLALSCLFW